MYPSIFLGHYWQIVNELSTQLPVGLVEDNVLRLSAEDAAFIVKRAGVANENEMAAEALAEELSDQFVAALVIEGAAFELDNVIAKTALAVYGEHTAMQLLDDDYWQYVGGAITHTTDEEQVLAWSSVLLPTTSHYYPNAYR